ncbi:MAG: UDP-3-O-(3-hydroxymyristoyl)glucosamine N-acyltransferase [bacterium]
MTYTLEYIANLVRGELEGDPSILVQGVSGINEAKEGDITFLHNPKYTSSLETTNASVVLIPKNISKATKPVIRCQNPYLALAKVIELFYKTEEEIPGISDKSVIGKDCRIGKDVTIYPYTYIGKNVTIEDKAVVYPHVYIGDECTIGNETVIFSNVSIYCQTIIGSKVRIHSGTVIGSDGFGYAHDGKAFYKIPQVGKVIIEDEVEIGANVTIDRGSLGQTIIKRGAKIDNLVQLAHNVVVGEGTAIAAQSGISGSTTVGKNVVMGGQAAAVGHINIGDNTMVAGRGGVSKTVKPGSKIAGFIGMPVDKWHESEVLYRKLPELYKTIKELKKMVEKIEDKKLRS